MRIAHNSAVTLRQRITDSEGELIDDGAVPIQYVHGGYGTLFPRVEAELDGKTIGDGIQLLLTPNEAGGEIDPALTIVAPLDAFSAPPQVGDEVERTVEGIALRYRVTALRGDEVDLDANHPLAGRTLQFSATVADLRPATAEEIAEAVRVRDQEIGDRIRAARLSARTHTWAEAAAEQRAEADELAKAEAADLVETVYVKEFGKTIRFIFRSQTHKLCWLAPLFLLPALGIWLGVEGHEVAGGVFGGLWLAWTFFFPTLIRMAIDRWGFRFLFFDFSPNPSPSRLESAIITGGQVASFLGALIYLVVALFHLKHASDLWGALGATIAVLFLLVLILTILLPFLVTILTAFRIRPIVDKVPPAPQG